MRNANSRPLQLLWIAPLSPPLLACPHYRIPPPIPQRVPAFGHCLHTLHSLHHAGVGAALPRIHHSLPREHLPDARTLLRTCNYPVPASTPLPFYATRCQRLFCPYRVRYLLFIWRSTLLVL